MEKIAIIVCCLADGLLPMLAGDKHPHAHVVYPDNAPLSKRKKKHSETQQ